MTNTREGGTRVILVIAETDVVQGWRDALGQGVVPGQLIEDTAALAARLRLGTVLLDGCRPELCRSLVVQLGRWDRFLLLKQRILLGDGGRWREDRRFRDAARLSGRQRWRVDGLGVGLGGVLVGRLLVLNLLLLKGRGAGRRRSDRWLSGGRWLLVLLLLIVVRLEGLFAGRLVDQGRWRDRDTLASRLEPVLIRPVFDHPHLPRVVHETVFTLHLACRQFRLDLERAIRSLEPVRVRPVLVVPVDLFQDGDRGWFRGGGAGRLPVGRRINRVTSGGRVGRSRGLVRRILVHVVGTWLLVLLARYREYGSYR